MTESLTAETKLSCFHLRRELLDRQWWPFSMAGHDENGPAGGARGIGARSRGKVPDVTAAGAAGGGRYSSRLGIVVPVPLVMFTGDPPIDAVAPLPVDGCRLPL